MIAGLLFVWVYKVLRTVLLRIIFFQHNSQLFVFSRARKALIVLHWKHVLSFNNFSIFSAEHTCQIFHCRHHPNFLRMGVRLDVWPEELRDHRFAAGCGGGDANPKFDAIYIYDSYNGIYDLWIC